MHYYKYAIKGSINQISKYSGFTYLGLLFFIAMIGIGLATTGVVWKKVTQREKEAELLFIGEQFRQAIGHYHNKTPGAIKQYPKNLDNLIIDNRQVTTTRHLRKIYRDPITNQIEWGLVKQPDGGIVGVFSLSTIPPIKTAGFKEEYEHFQKATSYKDWKFIYIPTQVASN